VPLAARQQPDVAVEWPRPCRARSTRSRRWSDMWRRGVGVEQAANSVSRRVRARGALNRHARPFGEPDPGEGQLNPEPFGST
jgi:hypothetical protein